MSLAREDWRSFEVLSGQMVIGDPMKDEDGSIVIDAEGGEWVAMPRRDETHHIVGLAAMKRYVAEKVDMEDAPCIRVSSEPTVKTFETESMVVAAMDRAFCKEVPPTYSIPEQKLNDELLSVFGRPEGKTGKERFVETCFHLGYEGRTKFQRVEPMDFGFVFGSAIKKAKVCILYDDGMDAIMFEIMEEGDADGRC